MDLLQLRYFYESAKNESFSTTAKKYIVPTSSVSASVKRLEKELGVNLFDRTTNKIKLNDKGYAFYEAIDDIFKKLDNAVFEVSADTHRNVTIRILIKARRKWITDLIIQYRERFPYVRFKIVFDAAMSDFESYDVIIDEKSDKYLNRESFLLSTEKICVKAAKSHYLAGKTLNFSQLKDEEFVVTQKEGRMWKLLENTAIKSGFVPKVAIESNDRQCLIRYVEAGMGLCLGSQSVLNDESEKNLVKLNITDFNERQLIYVHHKKTDKSDTTLNSFLAFLKTQCV